MFSRVLARATKTTFAGMYPIFSHLFCWFYWQICFHVWFFIGGCFKKIYLDIIIWLIILNEQYSQEDCPYGQIHGSRSCCPIWWCCNSRTCRYFRMDDGNPTKRPSIWWATSKCWIFLFRYFLYSYGVILFCLSFIDYRRNWTLKERKGPRTSLNY